MIASMTVDAAVQGPRARGQRITVARRAVLEALDAYDGHPTVDEIATLGRPRPPSAHN